MMHMKSAVARIGLAPRHLSLVCSSRTSQFVAPCIHHFSSVSDRPCPVTGEADRGKGEGFAGARSVPHFRSSSHPHPLRVQKAWDAPDPTMQPQTWKNPTQNHVWSEAEIKERMSTLPVHIPESTSDKIVHFIVKTLLYNGFNKMTGFSKTNPGPKSCEWRLMILESIAGCPGMVAAGMRHFKSLRNMERDHGWIHTLLEEAENERMHLLVVMKMFKPNLLTRSVVIGGQMVVLPLMALTYLVHPKALHRFVGYLEETACQTYHDLVTLTLTEGTELHAAWGNLPAPAIAKSYWQMDENSMWVDVLKNLYADESNHRDVNHTFAKMNGDDPNPWVKKHHEDAAKAWMKESPERVEDAYVKRKSQVSDF
jgi:hypothetical protein